MILDLFFKNTFDNETAVIYYTNINVLSIKVNVDHPGLMYFFAVFIIFIVGRGDDTEKTFEENVRFQDLHYAFHYDFEVNMTKR